MTPTIRPPSHDEPAVTSPELRRLVDAARALPVPPLRRGADEVFAAVAAARAGQRRRGVLVGGLLVAAAAVAALVIGRLDTGMSQGTGSKGQVAEHMAPGPAEPTPLAPRPRRPGRTPAPLFLDPAVQIVAEGEAPSPTVLGPWDVGLAPGTYSVTVAEHPTDDALRARSAGGTVELHHGSVQIVVGAAHTEAQLQHGVATFVHPLGDRTPLALPAPVPPDSPDSPDPAELARRAEAQLTAGKRDAAIKLLTQLVTSHPQHVAARSALMDLGKLLKTDGRTDEARCAYRLYLSRYSGKAQLADEVEKALARLGDGPACRGLRPR